MKPSTTVGSLFPLIASIAALPPVLLVAAAVLAVVLGSWPWNGLLAAGLTVLASVLDGAVAHRREKEPLKLRVATWNVDSNHAPWPDLIEFLREVDVDVLCLQEFYYRLDPDRLAAHFEGWHIARSPLCSRAAYDTVTLSRYPLGKQDAVPLGRSWCLRTEVLTPHGPVWVANIRLSKAKRRRFWLPIRRTVGCIRWQGKWLSDLLENHQVDVLAGDFNSPPLLRPYPPGLEDSYRARAQAFAPTFPARFPLWRLDYVLVAPRLGVLDHQVHPMPYSDHRAIVVELTW